MNLANTLRLSGRLALLLSLVGLAAISGCRRSSATDSLPARPALDQFPSAFKTAIDSAEASVARDAKGGSLLALGQLYHANRFFAEARQCYRPLLADSHQRAKACYYLADLAESEGNLDEAVKWFRQTLENVDYRPGQLRLANAYYKSGDSVAAEKLYQTVLAQDPNHAEALFLLAVSRARAGDDVSAMTLLEKLMAKHPDFSGGAAFFAQLLQRKGNLARAASMRIKAQAHKDPPPADPWMDEVKVRCYDLVQLAMRFEDEVKSGRTDESMRWLERIEAIDPNHWIVSQIRGLALTEKGDFAGAVREYERAIAGGGDPSRLYPALIGVLVEMKRYPEADEKARIALQLVPDTLALKVAVAQLREQEGQSDAAVTLLRDVLAKEPRHTAANRMLGLILWGTAEQASALPFLRVVLETAPTDVALRGMLGQYFLEKGMLDEAIAPLEQANALDPRSEPIAELLGLAYLRVGNRQARDQKFSEALASYDRALVINPSARETYANKAQIQIQLNQFDGAAATLGKLAELEPANPNIALTLGDVQRAAGHEDLARTHWTRAEKLLTNESEGALREAIAQRLGR